jgi:hypothetical protein
MSILHEGKAQEGCVKQRASAPFAAGSDHAEAPARRKELDRAAGSRTGRFHPTAMAYTDGILPDDGFNPNP